MLTAEAAPSAQPAPPLFKYFQMTLRYYQLKSSLHSWGLFIPSWGYIFILEQANVVYAWVHTFWISTFCSCTSEGQLSHMHCIFWEIYVFVLFMRVQAASLRVLSDARAFVCQEALNQRTLPLTLREICCMPNIKVLCGTRLCHIRNQINTTVPDVQR